MPELPEVETVARELKELGVIGRELVRIVVRDRRLVRIGNRGVPLSRAKGVCSNVARHGKVLVLEFSNGWKIILHLGMSGRMCACRGTAPFDKHERLRLVFRGGLILRFVDPRRFGKAWCVGGLAEVISKLGPDALRIGADEFAARVAGRARMIKPLLMDQKVLAGLGNIYADETLWRAGVHPMCRASTLTNSELRSIWRSMRAVLSRAIRDRGTSLGDGKGNFAAPLGERGGFGRRLKVYGRAGMPCARCGEPIAHGKISQRSACWCPHCQPFRGDSSMRRRTVRPV